MLFHHSTSFAARIAIVLKRRVEVLRKSLFPFFIAFGSQPRCSKIRRSQNFAQFHCTHRHKLATVYRFSGAKAQSDCFLMATAEVLPISLSDDSHVGTCDG